MCELLGLSFRHPVRCAPAFDGFRNRSEENPHGWGIARFEGRACQVFKEPVKALDSKLAAFLHEYESFVGTLFIGHVRKASRGELSLQNTHPFVRVLGDREIAFAHNGTVEPVLAKSDLAFLPVGDTDSEHLFCAVLTRLSGQQIAFSEFARIEAILAEFNHFGTMNVLFSEGDRLYCYRDKGGHNGLCITERIPPASKDVFADEDWKVGLVRGKRERQRGYVIATRPFTDETWKDLPCGKLLVLEAGNIRYGGIS
jgi:glutamine amidotransferase